MYTEEIDITQHGVQAEMLSLQHWTLLLLCFADGFCVDCRSSEAGLCVNLAVSQRPDVVDGASSQVPTGVHVSSQPLFSLDTLSPPPELSPDTLLEDLADIMFPQDDLPSEPQFFWKP